jgi:hypothetical protein
MSLFLVGPQKNSGATVGQLRREQECQFLVTPPERRAFLIRSGFPVPPGRAGSRRHVGFNPVNPVPMHDAVHFRLDFLAHFAIEQGLPHGREIADDVFSASKSHAPSTVNTSGFCAFKSVAWTTVPMLTTSVRGLAKSCRGRGTTRLPVPPCGA